MINKPLKLFVIFILMKSASSTLRGRYNFNHPPSVEYYNPIPVSVVYDEDAIPRGKIIKSISNEHFEDFSEETVINKNNESPLNTYRTRNVASVNKNNEKINLKSHNLPLNAFQIPVDVIYDSEDDVSEKYIREKKSADFKPTKPSQPQNRQPQQKDNLQTKNESDKVHIPSEEKSSQKEKRTRERKPVVPILESENYVFSHSGNFHYSYEGGDGTKAYSRGELIRNEDDEAGEAVVGGFSYKDKDGNDVSLSYTADENGYRPEGAHLPTPPPIPPAIARALQYLATATTPQPVTEILTGF